MDPGAKSDQPSHSYDYGFDLGGPILKDRLWFFAGVNPTYYSKHNEGASLFTSAYASSVHAAIPYSYDSSARDWIGMAKLTFRANENHHLEFSFLTSPQHAWLNEGVGNFLGGAPLVPVTDPMARMTRRYQSGFAAGLKWYANWTQNFYMETEIARVQAIAQVLPWTEAGYSQPQIISLDWAPNVSVGARNGHHGLGQSLHHPDRLQGHVPGEPARDQVRGAVGRHEVGRLQRVHRRRAVPSAGPHALGRQPLLVQAQGLRGGHRLPHSQNPHWKTYGGYLATFAQDTWSITDYVNLAYGVRWEQNSLRPPQGQHASFNSWSPRVGLTWDFAGNGKSKAYVNWGAITSGCPSPRATPWTPATSATTTPPIWASSSTSTPTAASPRRCFGHEEPVQRRVSAGRRVRVRPDFTVGFYALSRSLGDVLEDVAYPNAQGGFSYYLMNRYEPVARGHEPVEPPLPRLPALRASHP